MKLIQITDTHLLPPGNRLYGRDPVQSLAAAIADVNANHGDADLCLLTGDLTDDGSPAAYDALRACLQALQVPWRLLPGNHDDRARLRAAFPDQVADADAGEFLQARVDLGEVTLLLLDTHEPGRPGGTYCAERLAWLEAALAATRGRAVYLFMHHPPCPIGIPSLDVMALYDADAFAAVVRRHDHIRQLTFGHVHRPIAGSWHGIPIFALRGTNHQVAFDQVTAAPVPKASAPPAYAVMLLDAVTTVVHTYEYLDEQPIPNG